MSGNIEERWRRVVGHEGFYEVSDQGRVRSLDRSVTYRRWDAPTRKTITVTKRLKGKLLRPGTMTAGHQSVALGKGNSRCVHVLVLEAFVGPCPAGHEGLHGDDCPDNNVLGNLRWGTRGENIRDAIRNGGRGLGERWWRSKLKDADIPVIRSLFGRVSYAELGRRYGVSESTIRQIKNGRAWTHIAEAA